MNPIELLYTVSDEMKRLDLSTFIEFTCIMYGAIYCHDQPRTKTSYGVNVEKVVFDSKHKFE